MNLLICDYDNTIVLHKKIKKHFKKNYFNKSKKSLKKYRDTNNFIMISTGRYYESIIKELRKNNIEYDYLSCNYGSELYDNKHNLLYCIPLSSIDTKLILKRKYENVNICEIKTGIITSIKIVFDKKNVFEKEYNYLKCNLKSSYIEKKYPKLKIINTNSNKIKTVDFVIDNNKFDNVYSIGDDIADYDVLKKYNGYTLPWGLDGIQKISSISKLIKLINLRNNIPKALCIGFAKCGTTTLYDIFKQNDDIYLSGIKEPVYYGYKKTHSKGFEWYLKRYYPNNTPKVIVEINPRIAKYAQAKEILADYGKNTKIIILIRNPIKRLYSNFKMNLNTGKCFDNLKKHLLEDTSSLFDEWVKENFYKEDDKILLRNNINTNKMLNGEYYRIIEDYYNIFGKKNVYVCFFEDFIKDKEYYSQEMFDFIGVKPNKINYDVFVNKGNRIPKNSLYIKINHFAINRFWKNIIIFKLPFISNSFSQKCNKFIWKLPILLSKENKREEKISEYATKIITLYYYDMITDLSKILEVDLFTKWGITKEKSDLL